jgi:RimJ/RimL family protein N-acetyltransferase
MSDWRIFPRLETARLVLREIVPAEAEDPFHIFSVDSLIYSLLRSDWESARRRV